MGSGAVLIETAETGKVLLGQLAGMRRHDERIRVGRVGDNNNLTVEKKEDRSVRKSESQTDMGCDRKGRKEVRFEIRKRDEG